MAHPLYNPYASGSQSSTQGQYGLPIIQAERDPRRASHLGPGSSLISSGASSAIPCNSGGMPSSLMSQSMNYRPEQSQAIMDKDIERSIEMHISRAREEVRVLGKPMHPSIVQDTLFTSTQRDEFRFSGPGMASYPMSPTSSSLEHKHLDVESGSSSLDWPLKMVTADDSKFHSSSVSSNYASSGDSRFNASSGKEHDMQSNPGLGDYDNPVQDKPAAPTESSRPKFTTESAANILKRFGLEKEDLELLLSYPEDQITPSTLPSILRQIRLQKAKKATAAVQSKPYHEPQPTRSMSAMDSHSLSSSGGRGMNQEEMSSAVLQPSNVIDYGHTSKYTGVVGEESGKTSGSRTNIGGGMLLNDTFESSRYSQEPLQKITIEVKSSALGSSYEQTRSVTYPRFSYTSVLKSVAPQSHDQTKQLHTHPNQTSQPSSSLFSLPKKDTDRVFKSEASKPVLVKEPEADSQSTLKTQLPCTVFHDVHPSQPRLVLLSSNNTSGAKDQSKTQGQSSTMAEQMNKQQTQQQMQKQPMKQISIQQQLMQNQPVSQTGQVMCPPVLSAEKSVPPAPLIPSITDASRAMHHPVFTPGEPCPISISPALPQPVPALASPDQMTLQPPAKVPVSKGLPTPAMMQDYAAASPKIFPHTCSLCNKECSNMKDWVVHQKTSLHLCNCTILQKRYPDWDGEKTLTSWIAGKDAKPSPSTSAQTSQHQHQKTTHGSRSRSCSSSPCRRHGSEGRREKRSSRSRSPHSSRHTRRSRSRSCSPRCDHPSSSRYRSRSKSPVRRLSPRRKDQKQFSPKRSNKKQSSPKRTDEKKSSPRRSHERQSPPRRSDDRRSPPRRSDKRQSPPRRKDVRQSPPKRSDGRRSPPRRSDERRSPPRRKDERQSPPKRSDGRRSPPRRSDERRSPPRRKDERQLPPKRSDERRSPPKRSDERRSPPKKSDERLSPPKRSDERRSPPKKSDERRSPPKRSDERRSPPKRSDERRSPPKKSDERRSPPRRCNERQLSTEGSSLKQKKPSSAERLAEKLLTTSAVQSLTRQSDLEAVVKTLAPALLAELVKKNSSSSSSPAKMELTSKPPKPKPNLQKREASSFTKTKSGKSSPPTMVKLQGIHISLSHNDVVTAVEQFGKTKSVVLFRSKMEVEVGAHREDQQLRLHQSQSFDSDEDAVRRNAIVCFEKEEDAKELKSVMNFDIKGMAVTVFRDISEETVSMEQKKPPQKKPVTSSVSTPQTTKSTTTSTTNNILLPRPFMLKGTLPSGAKKASTDQPTNQKISAKCSVKGLTTAPRAKVLVSKARNVSIKQIAKTVKTGKLPAKRAVIKAVVKQKPSSASKSVALKLQPDAGVSKLRPIPEKSDISIQGSVVVLKETVDKSTNKISEPTTGKEIVSEAQVLASKAAMPSAIQKSITPADKLTAAGAVEKEKIEDTAAKAVSVPSNSTTSENQPDVEDCKAKESKTKVQEAVVVQKDKAEVVETANVTVFISKDQANLDKAKDTEDAEPMQLGDTGVKVVEPMEVGSCALTENSVAKSVSVNSKSTASENCPDSENSKPKESKSKVQEAETWPTETSFKALPHIQQSTLSEPESTKQQPVSEKSESSAKESVVVLKETTEVEKSAKRTVTGQSKGEEFTEAKASPGQKPQTPVDKSKECETKVQVAAVVQKDKAEIVETANVTVFESKDQANLDKAHDVEDAEPMQLGDTGAEVAEPMEVGSCAEGKGKKAATAEVEPEDSADKPIDSQQPTCTVETWPTETSVKALPDVQQSTLSEPEYRKQKHTLEKSESSAGGSVVVMKETAKVDQSANRTVTEATKVKEIVSEAKVLASRTEMASATQMPQTPADKSAAASIPLTIGEMVEKHLYPHRIDCLNLKTCRSTQVGTTLLITKLPSYHNLYYTENDVAKRLMPFGFQYKDDTIYVVPQMHMAFVRMPHFKNALEIKKVYEECGIQLKQAGLYFHVVADGFAVSPLGFYKSLMKLMNSPVEDDEARTFFITNISSSEARDLREALKKICSVRNYLPLLNKVFIEFESVHDADQFGVWYSLLKPAPGYKVHRLTIQHPVTAVKTQMDATSAKDASVTTEPPAAAVSEKQQAVSTPASTAVTRLTPGEMIEKHLDQNRIGCYKSKRYLLPKYLKYGKKQVLITGLPKFYNGCYTEDDVAQLLVPFGFQYKDDTIYVIPQSCMALIVMPTVKEIANLMKVTEKKHIFFKGSKLCFRVVAGGIPMTPLEFYKSLMKMIKAPALCQGLNVVLIKNISPSEARDFREALKKISNYLPLLNKVFIEFESGYDADQFGVWYSLLKQAPGYKVQRLTMPHGNCSSTRPAVYIPKGSFSPFWVTLRTSPFLFPTMFPMFTFPNFLTVTKMSCIRRARNGRYMLPTVMLTGLPEGHYKHQDVAKLVWRYFPKQNLHSQYYNLTVLPLQRRAFLHFTNWNKCCDFVRDHLANYVSVRGCKLSAHIILEHMDPNSTEEEMYKSLMKLSNARVPESESLAERLLCVKISETSVDVIRTVMEMVASTSTFVSFLPLANRICIEMADSNSVMQVVEKYKTFSPDSVSEKAIWSKVQQFETVESLKQRLRDSKEFGIHTISVKAKPSTVKCQTQPPPSELSGTGSKPLQNSDPGGSTISELITAGPSATATSDVAMEQDGEKPGTEIARDSTVGPEANDDVEKVKGEEGSVTSLISTAELDTISVEAKPPTVKCQTQPPPSELLGNGSKPALQTSDPGGSKNSELITAAPSAATASDVAMEEDIKKTGTEVAMDSTVGPEANEDEEKAKGEEGSLTSSISTAEPDTISVEAKLPTVKCQTQPPPSEFSGTGSKPLHTSDPGGLTISELITAGPNASAASDVTIQQDSEKPGTEIAMDSTVGSEANKDVDKVKWEGTSVSPADVTSTSTVSSGNTVPAFFSPAPSATELKSEENFAELPQINTENFNIIIAAVHQHRLIRETSSQSKESQDDEVDDKVGHTSPKPHHSSSWSSRARRDRKNSMMSSGDKRTSTRSSKDYKSSASSLSSSSKSTEGSTSSNSRYVSPKKSKYSSAPIKSPTKPSSSASMTKPSPSSWKRTSKKAASSSKSTKGSSSSNLCYMSPKDLTDSYELTKSPTKPLSFASISKPSYSSSPLSTETLSSPGQKTQQKKSRFAFKTSNSASSGCSSRSSSTAREREKITSAASVEASMETQTETFRKEAKATKGLVTKSDHKVSLEGIAAKTVKSETKMKTSLAPQGHGVELNQAQSLEIDFNVRTFKDQKKNKEGEEDDVDKHPEEENYGENYQNLDSLDDQTDEQMDDGNQDSSSETQQTGPEKGPTSLEESYQVLVSVDDEGKARPEKYNEMEMDSSFQIPDSVNEDQAPTSQEDSRLVQDDGSTVKQLSEKDGNLVVDKSDVANIVGKDQETNTIDNFQELHTGSKQAPRVNEDGKMIKQKEEEVKGKKLSNESCKASKVVENLDSQIPNEDQQPQSPLKPVATETESDTDNKEKRTQNGEATVKKNDGPSERGGPTTTAPNSEEKATSTKKQDRMVKKYETRTKMNTTAGVSEKDEEIKEATLEMVYETNDSVEDKLAQDAASTERSGRRRSARGKKEDKITLNLTEAPEKTVRGKVTTHEILDSVETITTRSTRGQRERTSKKDALNEKTKQEDTRVRTRHTAARESQERNRGNTLKKEEKASPKESTPTKKRDIVRETLVTRDEEGDVSDNKQADKRSRSAKRKHSDDTEQSLNLTVNEVEEEEEEEKEAVTTRTRGQAKRTRQTPVRKSPRGKKVSKKDETEEEEDPADVLPPTSLDASSSLDKDQSTLSSDSQSEVQKTEVEAASRADVDAASAGRELQLEEEKEGRSRADIKVGCKQRREPVGPEAKRSRSQSPCVAADFKLPPFTPNKPLGQEFMLPAYFCNVCSVFCLIEGAAKDLHCSSQRHYDNLQRHFQELEQKMSRGSTQNSQSPVSE